MSQRIMEAFLKGIPGVSVYLDDIMNTGENEEAHLAHLEELLKRLRQARLRAKLFALQSN